jgi:hypothetical protein
MAVASYVNGSFYVPPYSFSIIKRSLTNSRMTPSERREAARLRSERWRRARWSLKRNAPLRELGLDLFGKQSIDVITPFDDLPINVVDGVA